MVTTGRMTSNLPPAFSSMAAGFPWKNLVGVCLVLMVSAGCVPRGASYEIGLGTTEVRGQIVLPEGELAPWHPLIVVYKYHYKFIPQPNQRDPFAPADPTRESSLTHPSAHVVRASESGEYIISMPSDVVAIQAVFMARQRLSDVFRYSRSLGVGRITYQANLPIMGNGWRSHFFTYLEPQLQNLIVEARYNLPVADQKILSDWLDNQRKFLSGAAKP